MSDITSADRPRSRQFLDIFFRTLQGAALSVMVAIVALSAGTSVLALLGILPWLEIPVSFAGSAVPQAGMILQLAFTGFCLALVFYLPAHARMTRLERTHREFSVDMNDIVRAYAVAHAEDREGVFNLSEQFDDVRDRIAHLRKHPDLAELEPELLEVAAQMSFASRDLARTYSRDRVERAKSFLQQRQEEVTRYREHIDLALGLCDELRRWLRDIEADERLAQTQITRLDKDLQEILPAIGYAFETPDSDESTIVPLSKGSKDKAG